MKKTADLIPGGIAAVTEAAISLKSCSCSEAESGAPEVPVEREWEGENISEERYVKLR